MSDHIDFDLSQLACWPEENCDWVCTGPAAEVPSRIGARIAVRDPAMELTMLILVDGAGRPIVSKIEIDGGLSTGISITLMRRLAVDTLMREALARSIVERSAGSEDLDPAYARFKPVDPGRVERVAEVYRRALAGGSRSPNRVVTAELGYSYATTARDLRLARQLGLLPDSRSSRAAAARKGAADADGGKS